MGIGVQDFRRRDVELVVQAAKEARRAADNLKQLTTVPDSARCLSVVITHLETAELWLKDLAGKTVEE